MDSALSSAPAVSQTSFEKARSTSGCRASQAMYLGASNESSRFE